MLRNPKRHVPILKYNRGDFSFNNAHRQENVQSEQNI